VPGTAQAAKGETGARIAIAPVGMGSYEYTVKVSSDKRRCKKNRKVTVWHDENANGKLDPGEYVIGRGTTNRRGKVVIVSSALPPVGDFVGVLVKQNDSCEGFEDSAEFGGFPN
jgi:hypothetical protein